MSITSSATTKKLFGFGTANANLVRQEDMRVEGARSMAVFAKPKIDALQEWNEIVVLSRENAAGLPDAPQIVEALRRNYLSLAIKRAQFACQHVLVVALGSGHAISDTCSAAGRSGSVGY